MEWEAAALVDAGRLRPLVDGERYGLGDVEAAYAAVEGGKVRGKVVVGIG
jgi:NADPH2:quinone reductase